MKPRGKPPLGSGDAAAGTCAIDDLRRLAGEGRRFGTIYADPPWPYRNRACRGAASKHYPTMPLDEICRLPVADLAAPNAHLHLWTTNAFLHASFDVIAAWGFESRDCFVWAKPQMGLGNYWRVSAEYLLLGTRGDLPFADPSLRSWGLYPRRKHSQKPDEVRKLVERASPAPRLELFAREVTDGWAAWGNEVPRALLLGEGS